MPRIAQFRGISIYTKRYKVFDYKLLDRYTSWVKFDDENGDDRA